MIALLGLLLPAISNIFPAFFSYLGKKQDVTLTGFGQALGGDVELAKAQLQADLAIEQAKAAQNSWIGAKIIGCLAGELTVIYFGSIVIDSMFHLGWGISKLPPPWDDRAWIILQSFIIVSPVAPVLSATSAWLSRR